jgi:hypothetical protein
VLALLHLEILLGERQLALRALERVRQRAHRVDAVELVAEGVGAGLGLRLRALAESGGGVVAGVALLEAGEDRLEGALADLTLAGAREDERSFAVALEQALALERVEERFEVERRIEVPLLLQVPHPVLGLFWIAAGRQQELIPDPHQVDAGEDLADQLGIEVLVAVSHAPSSCHGSVRDATQASEHRVSGIK